MNTSRASLLAVVLAVALAVSCASDEHALHGGDGPHAWNFSPRAELTVPDRALYACCPRDGGDMRIDGVVDGQGRVRDVVIVRPPATLGVTMGAACVAFRGLLFIGDIAGEGDALREQGDLVTQCAEAERRMGGRFLPPAIPGTSVTCVERMATSWTLREYAARPISIPWQCVEAPR